MEQAAKDRAANHGITDKIAAYFSDKANAEMRLYNATMKINRLELLKANIGLEMVNGYDELEKVFGDALKAIAIGENAPPLHPNCRCFTAAYYDDTRLEPSGVEQVKEKPFRIKARFKTGNDNIDEYIDKIRQKRYKTAKDITELWLESRKNKKGNLTQSEQVIKNGVKYIVDDIDVIFDPKKRDKEIAYILKDKYGFNVTLLPRVLKPKYIKTSDYLLDGIPWELKSPEGNSKNTIVDIIKSGKGQANNFVLDLDLCPLKWDEIERQIASIYSSDHILFADKIAVFKHGEIIKVFERQK